MNRLSTDKISSYAAAVPSATRDEPMTKHTTLKIGGPARLFVEAKTADDLVAAVKAAVSMHIPYAVVGSGSNLLVSDEGFEGVVILASERGVTVKGMVVTAAAGTFTSLVARAAADAGLAGFEWGATIPGTIAGAAYGNAGCFGGEMSHVLDSIDAYDVTERRRVTLRNAACGFAYRESRFKHEPFILLSVTLRLRPGDKKDIAKRISELMHERSVTQPRGACSAGCMFKNFHYVDEAALEILRRKTDTIPEGMLKRKNIGAGWLVDTLGLKGTSIGKAKVSEVHGNFVVNEGGARAQDIVALESMIKMKVRDELGIMLEDEVQLIGF